MARVSSASRVGPVRRLPRAGVLGVAILAAVPWTADGQDAAPRPPLPANVTIAASHQPLLVRMWRGSPTFRGQCARIAEARGLQVRIRFSEASTLGAPCAVTAVRPRSRGMDAEVTIGCARRDVELIAHEFEHLIEQLDDVRLADMARLAPALVRQLPDGTFETRRATMTGRRVAAEVASAR